MNGANSLFALLWKPIKSPQDYSEVQFDCPMEKGVIGEYQDEIRSYQVVNYTPRDVSCVRVFRANNTSGFSGSVSVLSENNFAIRSTFLTTFALRELLSQYRKNLNIFSGATEVLSESGVNLGNSLSQKYQREIGIRDMNAKIISLQNLLLQR